MTEQEFSDLLQSIENGTFIGNELYLFGGGEQEGTKSETALDDIKTVRLSEALLKNSFITKLTLIANNISDIGANALANVTTIEELDLHSNNIKAAGAKALANSKSLKILSLAENLVDFYPQSGFVFSNSSIEMLEMIEAFINNKNIINLSFQSCHLSDELITPLISKNCTIKILNVIHNDLTSKVLECIGENKTLEILNISSNEITDKGLEYLSQNTTLKTIHVNSTVINRNESPIYFLQNQISKVDSMKMEYEENSNFTNLSGDTDHNYSS